MSNLQRYVWSLLYSFYKLVAINSELRTIKYVIEKNQSLDLIAFFLKVKQMVGTLHSLQPDNFFLDKVIIATRDLPQLLNAIFGTKLMVKKTHLLTLLQSRSKDVGIIAAEAVAILIIDFVKCRDKAQEITAMHDAENNYMHDGQPKTVEEYKMKKALENNKDFRPEDPDQANFLKAKQRSFTPNRNTQKTGKSTTGLQQTVYGQTMGPANPWDLKSSERERDFRSASKKKPQLPLGIQKGEEPPDYSNMQQFAKMALQMMKPEWNGKQSVPLYSQLRKSTAIAQSAAKRRRDYTPDIAGTQIRTGKKTNQLSKSMNKSVFFDPNIEDTGMHNGEEEPVIEVYELDHPYAHTKAGDDGYQLPDHRLGRESSSKKNKKKGVLVLDDEINKEVLV